MSKTFTIVLNSANQVGSSNVFRTEFVNAVEIPEGSVMTLNSASLYNCFFNISPRYNNQAFSIKWIDGVTYSYTIPQGGYSIDTLGAYISSVCFNNGWYWYYNNQITYPINLSSNATFYSAQFILPNVPSQSDVSGNPTLYRSPITSFPSTRKTVQLTISSDLATMLGFPSQTLFPPTIQNTTYSKNSPSAPRMQKVFSVQLRSNWLFNPHFGADNNNNICQIPIGNVSFGSLCTYSGGYKRDLSINPITYRTFDIYLYDQDGNILDGSVFIDNECIFTVDVTIPNKK